MLAITNKSINRNYSIYPLRELSFQGQNVENTVDFIKNEIIDSKTPLDRKEAINAFKKKFEKHYAPGDDKLQNPKYHQYTVTIHMLRAMEEATKIVNGEHQKLNQMLSPQQQKEVKDIFKEKIAGIDKGSLFVLAMAFHDLDKLYCVKPKLKDNGKIWKVNPDNHPGIKFDKNNSSIKYYWSADPKTESAKAEFNKIAQEMNLPQPAIKYVHNIMEYHDNPLKCVIWEIENGRTNLTQLFDEMKQKTPFSLKELALVFLADQAGKGEKGWLDHLEQLSPWESLFNSMMAERPLEELKTLLKG